MTYKRTLQLLTTTLLLYRCATVTNPDGGPKDEIPPLLVTSNPRNEQTNFKGSTIELQFTEPIRLDNPKEEIIIIPTTGKKTTFLAKRNKLEIKPELPWQPNTTYTIKFREAVKDITEGNPVVNLNLAFSTGPYIDSLKISGIIEEALSEKIPEKITVAIFSSDTFNIFKHTPTYFTEATKDGTFELTNLKPGNYRAYAFQDKNKNLVLESKSEKFGFLATTINPTTDTTAITITLSKVDSRPLQLTSARAQADITTIRLNKAITDYTLVSTPTPLHTFGTDQTEIITYYPEQESTDSLEITLTATDSLYQKIDTSFYIKRLKADRIKQNFSTSLHEPQYITETGILTFNINHNKPLKTLQLDSIILNLDSTKQYKPKPANFRYTTDKKKITYTDTLPKLSPTYTKTITLGKGALISIHNDSSKADKKNIQQLTPTSSSILIVQAITKHKNYILQILATDGRILAQSRNTPKVTFRNLPPETVRIRAIIDNNQNGQWDTANYLTNSPAERTVYYQNTDKKFETPLRANWEVGPLKISF